MGSGGRTYMRCFQTCTKKPASTSPKRNHARNSDKFLHEARLSVVLRMKDRGCQFRKCYRALTVRNIPWLWDMKLFLNEPHWSHEGTTHDLSRSAFQPILRQQHEWLSHERGKASSLRESLLAVRHVGDDERRKRDALPYTSLEGFKIIIVRSRPGTEMSVHVQCRDQVTNCTVKIGTAINPDSRALQVLDQVSVHDWTKNNSDMVEMSTSHAHERIPSPLRHLHRVFLRNQRSRNGLSYQQRWHMYTTTRRIDSLVCEKSTKNIQINPLVRTITHYDGTF